MQYTILYKMENETLLDSMNNIGISDKRTIKNKSYASDQKV